jgi:hypothetical protein
MFEKENDFIKIVFWIGLHINLAQI